MIFYLDLKSESNNLKLATSDVSHVVKLNGVNDGGIGEDTATLPTKKFGYHVDCDVNGEFEVGKSTTVKSGIVHI